jgi:hypothetical protein
MGRYAAKYKKYAALGVSPALPGKTIRAPAALSSIHSDYFYFFCRNFNLVQNSLLIHP